MYQESKLTGIREANSIKSRTGLKELFIPVFPTNFTASLAKTIDHITKDVEKYINAHLVAHGMSSSKGVEWGCARF